MSVESNLIKAKVSKKAYKVLVYFNTYGTNPLACVKILYQLKLKILTDNEVNIAQTSNFVFWRMFHHFHQIENCHLQTLSVWKSLKFDLCERIQMLKIVGDMWVKIFYRTIRGVSAILS